MRSMTGYGTAEGSVGKGRLYVEIKSINHRFSEFNVKIPPRMGILEGNIRGKLQPIFQRGKVDVFFKEKEPLFGGMSIEIDHSLAHKYHGAVKKLRRELGLKGEGDFLSVVGLDRLVHMVEHEGSYEKLWGQIAGLIDKAVKHVLVMQQKEGLHTRKDQEQRLSKISKFIKRIRSQSAHALDRHFERVKKKVSGGQVQNDADEQRLQMEVAYIGGRQDIAEELTRLESHLKQYTDIIKQNDPIGRRLDFLLQEMNREANTIGAKAANAGISQMVVDCKAELERLKEQVQNIE